MQDREQLVGRGSSTVNRLRVTHPHLEVARAGICDAGGGLTHHLFNRQRQRLSQGVEVAQRRRQSQRRLLHSPVDTAAKALERDRQDVGADLLMESRGRVERAKDPLLREPQPGAERVVSSPEDLRSARSE